MSEQKHDLSRREFLKKTGIATGALLGGGIVGGLIGFNLSKEEVPQQVAEVPQSSPKGRMFFKRDLDFQILSLATERIFPKDDLGPGAIELGVPYFIDNQLAGNYGINAREYMQGPFYPGAPTQGYQSPLTRAEIFLQGIHLLEQEAQKRFGQSFINLEGEQMDEILTACQQGEIEMIGATSDLFFSLLRSATLEGAYADPMYGGNHNMDGWRMKNFPGHRAYYTDVIESAEFQVIEPQSLASMDQ